MAETFLPRGIRISTVFLGLDHRFGRTSQPLLFETMIFGGKLDQEMDRYSTWAQACSGHIAMVEKAKRKSGLLVKLICRLQDIIR